ncbi:MAG: FAD-dependent oxidoreductase, partial [Firmicutes bacterium]|nr:FAD-dependent oxidoreductase [Bacillota bacterium]
LHVPYRKTGKLIVASDREDEEGVIELYEQGMSNGCENLRIIGGEEARRLVNGLECKLALFSPETAITNPFLYCVALAENAHENGVDFMFDCKVNSIEKNEGRFLIKTGRENSEVYRSKIIVNCAGLGADEISSMAAGTNYRIFPCRGEYYILDEDITGILPMPVYPAPRKGIGGLGVHVTPTAEGNVIIGPSAVYIDSKDDYSVTKNVLDNLLAEAFELIPELKRLKPIGNYSGIRPKMTSPDEGGYDDFIIEEDKLVPGLFNMIGIESPGLTASVPAAKYMAGLIGSKLRLQVKDIWKSKRDGIVTFRDKTIEEQVALISADPEYGEILCRCRKITRGEIRRAIENPLGVRSLSGIKYRAWPMTGRCSGGYCLPKITEMLIKDYGM